jgi:drug/metabolite transporter (DMT)-like permease
MMYLLGAIAAGVYIYSLFRAFNQWNINTLQAIVVNYFTAAALGVMLHLDSDWPTAYGVKAALMGVYFIVLFNLTGYVARKGGLTLVAIAGKLSLVIPVIFSMAYLKEPMGWAQLGGAGLAFVAVWLVSGKASVGSIAPLWPLLLFLGSGLLDIAFKIIQLEWVHPDDLGIFSTMIFASAGLAGWLGQRLVPRERNQPWQWRNVGAGVALGVVNYCSVFFLLKALDQTHWSSGGVFAFHNLGIVVGSTLVALGLFREKLKAKQWIGLGIAVLSLVLLTA